MKYCLTVLKVLAVTASIFGIVLLTLPTQAQTPSSEAQIVRFSSGVENKASFPDIIANKIFVAVAYVQDETVYIRSATEGNGWVERTAVGAAGKPPADKKAAGGQPKLIFHEGRFDQLYVVWFNEKTNELVASLCQLASDSSPDCGSSRPISVNLTSRFDATTSKDGTVYAVRSNSDPENSFLEVFSLTGNSWALQATLRQGQVITSPQSPAIAASDNFLHLAFSNDQRKSISYYRYPLGQAGGTWTLQKQYDLSGFVDHSELDRPDIIANGSTVYMVWDARRNSYIDSDPNGGGQVDDAYGLIFAASANEGQTWPDVASFALSEGRLTNKADQVDDRRVAQIIKQNPFLDIPSPFEKVGLQPSMALSGTGVVLAWQQRPKPDCNRDHNGSSEIYTAFYDGTSWGGQTAVNNDRSFYDIDPSIAIGPDQKPHIVYMESAAGSTCRDGGEQGDYGIYYQGRIVTRFDPNAGGGDPTPTPQPILALSKTGPETVTVNSLITYTLLASNGGDGVATDVEIIDTVPAGTQYVSGGTLSGTDVRWQLNELAANRDEVVSYVVRAVEAITVTSKNYRLTASGGYSATGNTAVETQVIPLQTVKKPSLDIIKSADRFEADIGKRITYTLRIFNNGDGEATNLVVTDTLPIGAVYVSGGTQIGNDIRWEIPTLAAGQVTSVSFVVAAGQTVTNTNYQVTAAGGYQDIGDTPIVTVIETNQTCVPGEDEGCPPIDGTYTAYLPTLLKN